MTTTNTAPQAWTVLGVLQWTTEYLGGKGVEKARLESELLLADVLNKKRLDLYLQFDQLMQPDALKILRERVARRAKREPLQYILGRQAFYGVEVSVRPGALIPRPETERLVEEVLQVIAGSGESLRLLEWGTGTGAIALAIAVERPNLLIDAVEISPEALEVARENLKHSPHQNRITLHEGDFGQITLPGGLFDVVVSNPPYIRSSDIAALQPEVRDFEPRLALDGGEDGMAVISRMLTQAPAILKSGGYLFLEIGADQAPLVLNLARREDLWKDAMVLDDLAGRPRVFRVRKV